MKPPRTVAPKMAVTIYTVSGKSYRYFATSKRSAVAQHEDAHPNDPCRWTD